MVTVAVLGDRGYLGSVVRRRWAQHGARFAEPDRADYVVNCIRPDNLDVTRSLLGRRLIQPSTDAVHEKSDYAAVKRELETLPAVTIRAGIVDIRHTLTVAFSNWLCNPLTPLEWADLAWELRDASPAVHMAGRETLSRWEVATTAAALLGRPLPQRGFSDQPLSRVVHDPVRTWPRLAPALREFVEWAR